MANSGVTFEFAAESAKLRAEIDKVRKELKDLKTSTKGIDDGLKEFGATAKSVFGALGIATSIAGIASQMYSAAKAAVAFGDDMQKAAAKTGIGAGQFALLADAAKMSDVDVGALSNSLKKMQIAISEAGSGSKTQLANFAALGIEFENLRQLSPEDQFLRIADQISKLETPADRTRAAVELFGKAGADLLPFFEQGAAGIKKATDEIERLGGKLTDDQIQKLADVDDAVKRLSQSWANLARTLTAEVAPAVTEVLNRLAGNTADQVSTDLAFALAKLKDLQSRREPYTQPGFDKRVLADLDRQIEETSQRVGELRLKLESLNEAAPKGPPRRTRGPLEIEPPPGFQPELPEPPKPPKEKKLDEIGLTGQQMASAFGDIGRLTKPEEDYRVIQEQMVNDLLLKQKQEYYDTAAGKMDLFNATTLGMLVNNADLMQQIEWNKNATLGDAMSTLVGMAIQQGGTLGKAGKALYIAQTVWTTGAAIMRAFSDLGPIAGIGPAAAIAAAGAAQLANIKRTNVGSGGSIISARGGSVGATAPSLSDNVQGAMGTPLQQQSAVQIIVQGSLFAAQETVDWLTEQIGAAVMDRDVVFISGNSRQAMELRG